MGILENRDAQFMLLAGFIIAIGLVITTVMLNSVIFEINMATEASNEFSKNEITNLILVVKDEIRSAYTNATAAGENKAQKISNFSNQTRNFSTNLQKIYALHGTGVNISMNSSNWNVDRYADFTDTGTAGGKENWTVMESVRHVDIFELRNVSGSDFEVNVSNQTTGSFLWSVKLMGNNDITIKNASSSASYTVNYDHINLLNVSYSFNTSVGNNISKILFLDGAGASGRFNITGNTSYGRNFTRAHDYVFNSTMILSSGKIYVNITIPVSVPW